MRLWNQTAEWVRFSEKIIRIKLLQLIEPQSVALLFLQSPRNMLAETSQ